MSSIFDFCDKIPIKTENDVLLSPLWYNCNISNEKLFFPTWFKKGVECVGDIIDSNCEILDSNCLEQKYSIKQSNFLETYRLKWLIRKYISARNIHLNEKWKNELNCKIEEQSWTKIFTICFKVINNKNLIWFQYRIIHKILGTEELLHKMSIKTMGNVSYVIIARKH